MPFLLHAQQRAICNHALRERERQRADSVSLHAGGGGGGEGFSQERWPGEEGEGGWREGCQVQGRQLKEEVKWAVSCCFFPLSFSTVRRLLTCIKSALIVAFQFKRKVEIIEN
jgi:hypothetical protein